MIGLVFGRWSVIGFHSGYGSKMYWLCRCRCGVTRAVMGKSLKSGRTNSCGCLQREVAKKLKTKHSHTRHGKKPTRTYTSWINMKQRTLNENVVGYKYYGGRGIAVCERWLHSFENFLSDMGLRPRLKSLDRINCNGNYEPGNCQWATRKEQAQNGVYCPHCEKELLNVLEVTTCTVADLQPIA